MGWGCGGAFEGVRGTRRRNPGKGGGLKGVFAGGLGLEDVRYRVSNTEWEYS